MGPSFLQHTHPAKAKTKIRLQSTSKLMLAALKKTVKKIPRLQLDTFPSSEQ
jgi:hypothetical protein